MTLEEAQALIASLEESVKKLEAKNVDIIAEKRQEQTKREEAEAEKLKADELVAKEQGNFEELLRIEKAKNEELVNSLTEKTSKQFKQLEAQLLTSKVSELSKSLGGDDNNAEVLSPHIAKRMKLEDKEGVLTLVVLDEKGQSTDKTAKDLEEEFRNTEKFANNIKGTGSSGGGAGGTGSGSGGGNATEYEQYFKRDANGSRTSMDKMMELKELDKAKYEDLLKKYP